MLPPSITTGFQGTAQAFQSSIRGLWILLLMAILVIYIVLGILYESYIHPLTILSGLPSAGVGALLTLLIFNAELDIYGFVGIIMLIGLVKKNAIMMIDLALEAARKEGKSPAEAILRAAWSVPSHYDDHHVRSPGDFTDSYRFGSGSRSPPSIGLGSGRGAAFLAIHHPLYYSRHLYLP